MSKKALDSFISWLLVMTFIFLAVCPSVTVSHAAPEPETLSITIEYNQAARNYTLSFPAVKQPYRTEITWHDPSGNPYMLGDTAGIFEAGRVTFTGLSFLPDHIYDIHVEAYANAGDTVPYAAGDQYYLADISFTGESFNVMAKMGDIEDDNYDLIPAGSLPGQAVTVSSGNNPKLRLRWKIPTIYNKTTGTVEYVTNRVSGENQFLQAGQLSTDSGALITSVGFQIIMNKGKSATQTLNFSTDYNGSGNMILEGTSQLIDGINAQGKVVSSDGYVTLMLDKNNGIEPGTEYEYTNIGIVFENAASEQITLRRTNLRTDSDNHFLVRNIDNAFRDYGSNLSSIFTPLQFEITKADVDKVQVIFRRVTNGIYPELFYQVQYAPRIDDLYTQSEKWVKIPDSVLSAGQMYGSEIVEITLSGTQNPEYYFRVVFYDSSSVNPISSSLCLDLRLLGVDSGKPPLPREIEAEPIYSGRKDVIVPSTDAGSGQVKIPMSGLRLSFEKPLNWKLIDDWNQYRNQAYTDDDYTFHVLLGTYLPETNASPEKRTIGLDGTQGIYMPVRQKRVLVFGKQDLCEDPNDPDRLVIDINKDRLLAPLAGDKLFWDYTANKSIAFENNEDPSEDGVMGDYPSFLVPNTTYYMQIFTSRYGDNDEIDSQIWANGLSESLKSRLSYVSPIISFTTWPLNEMPVPMPEIRLGIQPEINVDPVTGEIRLEGITVNYDRVLSEADWRSYTTVRDGRLVRYEIYISQNASDENSFVLVETDDAVYPDETDKLTRHVVITRDGKGVDIKPNTVYYIKARASLVLRETTGGTVTETVIGSSVFTPVKAITTPKIDTGNIDDSGRKPRAPSEFNIAADSNGDLRLSDAWVELSWIHAEKDATYELICTSTAVDPEAKEEDFDNDSYNLAFINTYSDFKFAPGDLTMTIDPNDPDLASLGFTIDGNGRIILPIRRDLLRPNRTYFFSLRAVRNQGVVQNGESMETVSIWVTVPVTTKMVKAPEYLEAVKDLQVGFNVRCYITGSDAESMELYMKKAAQPESGYVKLLRSQYSVVKDGNTYYFRVYKLEPDTLYHFRIYNKAGDKWLDYDDYGGTWENSKGDPVPAKTRDTLHQIEVRWEGEEPYEYYLEIRDEDDTQYEKLVYNSTGFTDYGYDLPDGSRIKFYREKVKRFVDEKAGHKYIYYALISGRPVRDTSGSITHRMLDTNTLYYVKLWAYNLEESLHIGPVSIRTDFSQEDYDEGKKRDNVEDVYNASAEQLLQKYYWLIDKNNSATVRALIKGDVVSGLLQASPGMTITVDFSAELAAASAYDILVPQKVLETIESNDSRLNIKLAGAEFTLNRGSIDLERHRQAALTSGAKEAMLRVRIERKNKSGAAFPSNSKLVSGIYDLRVSSVGSRYTYAELNTMIHKILTDPTAIGPFKYGIFDRELAKVLHDVERYSYRSHTELKDMIGTIMTTIEAELSRYLKDILDGGSGVPAGIMSDKPILSFPGRIGFKIEYQYEAGLIVPYAREQSSGGWAEVTGAKGYVMQVVLFRVNGPGEYAVLAKGSVPVSPGSSYEGVFGILGSKYDLTKVFGNTTIYPDNPMTGQQAVMLYAVISGRENELAGLTPNQKVASLGIGDILGVKELTGYMDNQASVSLAVRLYCEKSGIPPSMLVPSGTIVITNASQINTRLYRYVVLGIDLGYATTRNGYFDAASRSTTGQILDMVSKVLEMVGEI